MKKKSVIIYSVFAIAFYIFSLILFGSSLYKEAQEGKLKSEESFNFISNKLIQTSSRTDFELEAARILSKFAKSSDRIAEVSFKANQAYIFLYPDNPVADSRYLKNFNYSYSDSQKTYKLEAKIYLIRPARIFDFGKTSFLLILTVTVVTLILIVIVSNQEEERSNKKTEEKAAGNEEENVETEETEEASDNDNAENEEAAAEEESQSSEEGSENAEVSEVQSQVSFNSTLTESLRDSIANEKEFAIFVMKILGIERTTEEYRKLIELLSDRLKVQNMVFEGKNDTLIILKQDTNLDENLTLAENTINEIENTFPETKPVIYTGISNRNCRIVTGERLLFEAEAALEHAEEAEEKVIAFRANTEQYNDFMNQQN